MNPVVYPPELVDELMEWFEPIGKNTPEFIDELQQFATQLQGTTPKVNVYWCKNKHDTVTIDRAQTSAQKTITCPYCQQEARSVFYMCDQKRLPTHEFYLPKDYKAFPVKQRNAIKNGALAFKPVYSPEPIRKSTKLKIKL